MGKSNTKSNSHHADHSHGDSKHQENENDRYIPADSFVVESTTNADRLENTDVSTASAPNATHIPYLTLKPHVLLCFFANDNIIRLLELPAILLPQKLVQPQL